MKTGQLNVNKLTKYASYFRQSRVVNREVYNCFFDRISSHYGNAAGPITPKDKQKLHVIRKSSSFLKRVVRQFIRLPAYLLQYFKIVQIFNDELRPVGVVAIASSRLQLNKDIDIRHSILELSKILGSDRYLDVVDMQCKTDDILLFDPLMESDYWYQKGKCWQENIFIIDGAFLLFVSIWAFTTSLLSRKNNSIKFVLAYLHSCQEIDSKSKGRALVNMFECGIYQAIARLFSSYSEKNAVFFTSNSTLTEILRFYLLQDNNSIKIIEVLHGIIASPTEKYYHSILKESTNGCCHYFVPQISELPDLKLLASSQFYPKDVAINGFINKSVNNYTTQYGSMAEFFKAQLHQYRLNQLKKDTLILTVYGGTSLQGNYFRSAGFKLELELIDKAIQYSKELNLEIQFLYAPHPNSGEILQEASQSLISRDIKAINDSFFSYFITDYCISILSSCIFELAWLGAKSFTPLLVQDGLYSKGYLNKVFHPENNTKEALNKEFGRYILSGKNKIKSINDKIDKRMKLIN